MNLAGTLKLRYSSWSDIKNLFKYYISKTEEGILKCINYTALKDGAIEFLSENIFR